jgi:Skp family chaperone for outer membrane proteins
MKNFRVMLLGLLVVTFSLSSALGTAWAAKEKIAIVSVSQVFDEYDKTKEFDESFQTEGRIKQEERDAIVHEIRRLRDEQAVLSEDARSGKQAEIDIKLKELDEFDLQAKRDLGAKRNTAVREVFQDIENTLKQYGQRKGFEYILNDRALLFHRDSLNVTKDVIGELNKSYQKTKG